MFLNFLAQLRSTTTNFKVPEYRSDGSLCPDFGHLLFKTKSLQRIQDLIPLVRLSWKAILASKFRYLWCACTYPVKNQYYHYVSSSMEREVGCSKSVQGTVSAVEGTSPANIKSNRSFAYQEGAHRSFSYQNISNQEKSNQPISHYNFTQWLLHTSKILNGNYPTRKLTSSHYHTKNVHTSHFPTRIFLIEQLLSVFFTLESFRL